MSRRKGRRASYRETAMLRRAKQQLDDLRHRLRHSGGYFMQVSSNEANTACRAVDGCEQVVVARRGDHQFVNLYAVKL